MTKIEDASDLAVTIHTGLDAAHPKIASADDATLRAWICESTYSLAQSLADSSRVVDGATVGVALQTVSVSLRCIGPCLDTADVRASVKRPHGAVTAVYDCVSAATDPCLQSTADDDARIRSEILPRVAGLLIADLRQRQAVDRTERVQLIDDTIAMLSGE
jgi:hypothetical protein